MDRLHRSIIESTQEAVIFADRDGGIRLWNGGAERIFGWTAMDAVGKSLDLIIPEKLRGRHWEGWKHVMETGVTRYASDLLAVPAMRKDGTQISLEFLWRCAPRRSLGRAPSAPARENTVALIRDDAGAITGVAAVLRDVTERWQRDRELRARLAELEARPATASSSSSS